MLGFSLGIDDTVWNVLPVPLSALLVLQMATVPGQVSKACRPRRSPASETSAYSICLLHIPLFAALSAAGPALSSGDGPSPLWFVYLAVLMGLATVSFRRMERPVQKWLLQFSKRREPIGNRAAT